MQNIMFKIDQSGSTTFLVSDATKAFIPETAKTRRASHVEPMSLYQRCAFRAFRRAFGDDAAIAEWTRRWNCRWQVDLSPVGGPLEVGFETRLKAIEFEIEWLNSNFLNI